MRSTNSPTPTGNEKQTTFVREVWDQIRNRLNFYDSPTVRVEQTTRGVRFHSRPGRRGGGGGGSTTASFTFWTQAIAYTFQPGATVQVQSQLVIGGVTIVPGTYGCMASTVISGAVSATINMFPQFPYPVAPDMNGVTVYWMLIALGVTPVNVCSAGNKTIYLNASSPF